MSSSRIVAVMWVRDEEEIIEANLRHHIAEGVGTFLITDNGSADRTAEIARKFPEVKEVWHNPEHDYRQGRCLTRMARVACDFNPDWVMCVDADEFWVGLEALGRLDGRALRVGTFCEHVPLPGLAPGAFTPCQMPYYRQYWCTLPKMIHRPRRDIQIQDGNHTLVGVETKEIVVHHYPVRSYEQFEHKVVISGEALARRGNDVAWHLQKWYRSYQGGRLRQEYDGLVKAGVGMVLGGLPRWPEKKE